MSFLSLGPYCCCYVYSRVHVEPGCRLSVVGTAVCCNHKYVRDAVCSLACGLCWPLSRHDIMPRVFSVDDSRLNGRGTNSTAMSEMPEMVVRRVTDCT